MLYIRADSNAIIGTGHVMRCMAIAGELKKKRIDYCFLTAEEGTKQFILDRGFLAECIEGSWDNLEYELKELKDKLKKEDILLIDSYYTTKRYFSELKEKTTIVYIDDINTFVYPVDILINYNLYFERFEYFNCYKDKNTRLLLGTKYVPLREEFYHIKKIFREEFRDVLVTVGGSDSLKILPDILQYIKENKEWQDIRFHIVNGKYSKSLEEVKEISSNMHNILLYTDVKKMSDLMIQCDGAISAAGSTLYELCACQVPAVIFTFADNQIYGAQAFEEKQLSFYAGDYRKEKQKCKNLLFSYLKELKNNLYLRKLISNKMKELVDGKGSERIIKRLLEKN